MSRKIILYIAQSLDGQIADKDGGVGWLDEVPNPDKSDYGYAEFYDSIDTTIMGNKTYQQVLGFGIGNPYKEKKNFVLTRNKSLTQDDYVQYISENHLDFLLELKGKPGKDIWCVGGGALNAFMLNHGLLDEIRVFIMPVILGDGIPFTSQLKNTQNLNLYKSISRASSVMEIRYAID